jgi:hydrogenase expression/formation protein HypE
VRRSKNEGQPLAAGKIPLELLARLLSELPAPPPELRLGARIGEDACGIEVPKGVLVAATDPITLTSEEAGRLAVVVNANDVAVSGARPRWFLAVVLVPPGTTDELVDELFRSIRLALADLGAHLVGGHTEVTPAVTRPIVIGHMLGLADGGRVVTTGGFAPGDMVVQVRPAPIEGAAVLAREAPEGLATVRPALLEKARGAFEQPGISVVEPALLAATLGATALHDPTEGGLAGGLHEMACAAALRLVVDRDAMLWFGPGLAVCEALGADPWGTLASGTLLATFPPAAVGGALETFAREGHDAAVIGSVENGEGVRDTAGTPIAWPERDEVARLLSDGSPDAAPATI